MAHYLDEIPPDVVLPHEAKTTQDAPLRHLDTVIALYDFPGTHPSHLPLVLGDTIYLLSKSASGWWDGVIINNGAFQRGWFPYNYTRSVNYVQPVLNKLRNHKELDSITAANTAANVLIPSFTNLLQKNLHEFEKKSSSNTRKNSVVSFASSDTNSPPINPLLNDLPSPSVIPSPSVQSPSINTPPSIQSPKSVDPQSTQTTSTKISDKLAGSIEFTDLEEAERLIEEFATLNNKTVPWIPMSTTSGDFVFYCEQLDLYCKSIPLSGFDADNVLSFEAPTQQILQEQPIVPLTLEELTPRDSTASMFDPLKRNSTTSTISHTSSVSYHNFSQPFYALDHLFYKQSSDLSKWSQLKSAFNYLLDLTYKSLKEHNKQLFSIHFTRLNKLMSLVFSASRLTRNDYVDTKDERKINRRLKRIASSFAQIYMNCVLYLSVMHNSKGVSSDNLVSSDSNKLGVDNDFSYSPLTSKPNVKSSSSLSEFDLLAEKESDYASYYNQIEIETANLRKSTNALVDLFMNITDGKMVKRSDYDSSDASEEVGEDRSDILPQMYPRFLTDEFNGGNWCNPFFVTNNPILNASGDDLKNRYHQKLIIDQNSYENMLELSEKMVSLSDQTQKYLDPNVQHLYYNVLLKSERNTQILRLIYKYLYHASSLVDLIESLDFTVFCLIKKYSSSSGDPDSVQENLKLKLEQDRESKMPTSNLTFDYPIVLEFFQLKQQFHDLISNIIMSTQALTLEDPDVFKGIKDEDPLFYSKDALKGPSEKAAMLLTSILLEQSDQNLGNSISLNSDSLLSSYLTDSRKFLDTIQASVRQLIDEREMILNYATRVLHDDLNVQLLMTERNNTILSEKSEEGHSYYTGGQKSATNVPWFLEGDEEFDLLLDIKGNIKGGTREALVAQLTHHESCDSSYNSAFLTTFSTITSLRGLNNSLIKRFDIEPPEGLSYEEYNLWVSKKQTPIRSRVLNVMRLIIEKYWADSYYDRKTIETWRSFSLTNVVLSFPEGKELSTSLGRLLNQEKVFVDQEPILINTKRPTALLKVSPFPKKLKLLDIENLELARQLTLREFKLYSKITKHSCIAKVWGKKSGLTENIDSITSFIKASNQLTNFVSYMILRKNESRKRAAVIKYFVQLAEKCRQYNNFSSMTAIISALFSSPIHRLKRTWKWIDSDTELHLQNMNKLMNSSRNFNEYRDVLKFIGNEPCVPFFGVYLSDLTFVYHGNPDFLMNRSRLINFAKRAKTCEIVSGIDRFKTLAYNFHYVGDIQKFLDSWFDKCPTISEQYQLSLALEPREAPNNASNTATNNTNNNNIINTNTNSTGDSGDNKPHVTKISVKPTKPIYRGPRVPLPLG